MSHHALNYKPTNDRSVKRYLNGKVEALKKENGYSEATPQSFKKLRPALLKLIYEFGTEIEEDGVTKTFGKMVKAKENNPDRKVDQNNTFAVITERYIKQHFADHLSTGKLSLYTRALAYAYEHKITTNWLGAFLKEVGGFEKAAKKYSKGDREGWVIQKATFE